LIIDDWSPGNDDGDDCSDGDKDDDDDDGGDRVNDYGLLSSSSSLKTYPQHVVPTEFH